MCEQTLHRMVLQPFSESDTRGRLFSLLPCFKRMRRVLCLPLRVAAAAVAATHFSQVVETHDAPTCLHWVCTRGPAGNRAALGRPRVWWPIRLEWSTHRRTDRLLRRCVAIAEQSHPRPREVAHFAKSCLRLGMKVVPILAHHQVCHLKRDGP